MIGARTNPTTVRLSTSCISSSLYFSFFLLPSSSFGGRGFWSCSLRGRFDAVVLLVHRRRLPPRYFRQKFRTFRTTTTTASLSLLFFFSQPLYNQRPTSPSDRRARLRRSKAGCATAVSQCTATCLGSHRLSAYFLRPGSQHHNPLHLHNRGTVRFFKNFKQL